MQQFSRQEFASGYFPYSLCITYKNIIAFQSIRIEDFIRIKDKIKWGELYLVSWKDDSPRAE